MRNSLTPVLAVLVVLVLAMFALRSDTKPGLNGPDIYPGIFRLPKQDKFHVASADLAIDNSVTASGAPPANRGETWRLVLLTAGDRHALTRSTVLALAERLTGHGAVAIVDPFDAPPFPMGCERIIVVSTPEAQVPAEPGGPASATVLVETRLARLPPGHPADGLQPDPAGPVSSSFTIAHRSRAEGRAAGWPQWWAGSGRNLADLVLAQLAPGGLPPVTDPQTHRWLPGLTPRSDWGSVLTMPPTTDLLQWHYAFQEALVRGWIGHVPGLSTTTRRGEGVATLDQLLARMRTGSWEEATAQGVRLFSRSKDGQSEWFSIAPRTGENGWDVAWWQERSGIPDLLADWAEAAAAGDRGAALLLFSHRNCPALPPELRGAAEAAGGGAR